MPPQPMPTLAAAPVEHMVILGDDSESDEEEEATATVDGHHYPIQALVVHKDVAGAMYYLVEWEPLWIPIYDIHTTALIADYWRTI